MTHKRRVVITGLGLVSPLGLTVRDSWNALIAGTSGISHLSSPGSPSLKVKIAGEVKGFNPSSLPGKKKNIKLMNRDAQLAVAATDEALADAGFNRETTEPAAFGIAFGAFGIQYTLDEAFSFLREPGETTTLNPIWPLTILPNMSLCHSAITHSLQGPNIAFCSLTASGTQAVGEAFKSIQYGDADIFIAGGCSSLNPSYLLSLADAGLFSAQEEDPASSCRPFDKRRSGFLMGEGAAVLILEELGHALKRNAAIYGEVGGYTCALQGGNFSCEESSCDARVEGVCACIEETIRQAGIDCSDIDYINAEGNATVLSDRIETEAIKRVFGDHAYRLSVSSTKAATGHMLCASGPAEIIFSTLAMKHGIVPPTLNYEQPDPRCDLDYTPNQSGKREIQAALSLTMGLSGENGAVLIKAFA
jgi:3-oxoacyl-[acyl-carrier-protein] synthase II